MADQLLSEDVGPANTRPYKRLAVTRSRGDLRSDVLYAVRETLRLGSYETLTIEQVAAKASVSRRTLYNLFQDKDDIYRQSCESLIRNVADLVVDEIPERMSTIDGIRFYISSCVDVYGNAATKDLLCTVVRDGAHQAWLPTAYYRHVRDPLVRVCELFLLKKSRRSNLAPGVPRLVGIQIADIVKSISTADIIYNHKGSHPQLSSEQIDMIAQAHASIIDNNFLLDSGE